MIIYYDTFFWCISSLSVAKFHFWFCPVSNWTCTLFQEMFDILQQGMFPFFPRHSFHFRFDVCPVATWLRRFWRQHQQQPVTRGAGTEASHTLWSTWLPWQNTRWLAPTWMHVCFYNLIWWPDVECSQLLWRETWVPTAAVEVSHPQLSSTCSRIFYQHAAYCSVN